MVSKDIAGALHAFLCFLFFSKPFGHLQLFLVNRLHTRHIQVDAEGKHEEGEKQQEEIQ